MNIDRPELKYAEKELNAHLYKEIKHNLSEMHHRGFFPHIPPEQAIEETYYYVAMHNDEVAHRKTLRAQLAIAGWKLYKHTDLIKPKRTGCMDERDNEAVNTFEGETEDWRLPGSQLTVRDRKTGKILEPGEV